MRSYTRPAIRGRPDMGWKAHATWHGLSSPWVWDGPYAPPSAVRLPPSAVPSDSCAFCASWRPTLGHPPTRRVQHPNIPEGETILPAPKQSPPPSLLRLLFTRVPARALEVSWPRIGSISTSAEKNDPLIGLLYLFRDSTSSWRKSAAVGSHSPRMAASPADSYLPPGRGRSVANGGSP